MSKKGSRFSFRKSVEFDIALLSEVESLNPFAFKKPAPVWDDIANNLKSSSLKLPVNGRGCRLRVIQLLGEFRAAEQLSIKSTGVAEEEMNKLTALLTSVSKLEEDKNTESLQTLYGKQKRGQAEQTRSDAIDAIIQEYELEEESSGTGGGEDGASETEPAPNTTPDEESSTADQPSQTQPLKVGNSSDGGVLPKKPRFGKNIEIVDYLKQKNKGELEVRRQEVEARKMEAENRRLQLELAKQKQEAELEERREMNSVVKKLLDKLV